MPYERILLDTIFVIALLNQNDQHHNKAKAFLPLLRTAREVWITEAILVEIANGLHEALYRQKAYAFIKSFYTTPNTRIVNVNTDLLKRALELYGSRPDKTWGLTDCISFTVMKDENLTDALTGDKHFQQAGFRALMRDEGS